MACMGLDGLLVFLVASRGEAIRGMGSRGLGSRGLANKGVANRSMSGMGMACLTGACMSMDGLLVLLMIHWINQFPVRWIHNVILKPGKPIKNKNYWSY